MKRIISLVLAVLVLSALLVGCNLSFASDPTGKYSAKSVGGKSISEYFTEELAEYELSIDDVLGLAGVASIDELITLELKADGTAILVSAMDEENDTGTWTQDGNKITVTIDGDPAEFILSGNELSTTIDGQTYVFAKK